VLVLLVSCLPALALAGCVEQIAESRVKTALVRGGLSEANADCMAGRMVDRLTIPQLRKLEALAGQNRESLSRLSIGQFMGLVRQVNDNEVVAVTASSAALCATGIGL